MSASQFDTHAFVQYEINTAVTIYLLVGASFLAFYDWSLTFGREVERVWCRRRSAFTILWVAARYLPLASQILAFAAAFSLTFADKACFGVAVAGGLLGIVTFITSHIVYSLRVYALYARNSKILLLLSILLCLELLTLVSTIAAPFIILDKTPHAAAFPPSMPRANVPACLINIPADRFGLMFVSVRIAFDLVIVTLTVVRVVLYRRHHLDAPILRIFVRDGLGYFAVVATFFLATFVLFFVSKTNLRTIMGNVDYTLSFMVTNRLILNMRKLPPHYSDEVEEYHRPHARPTTGGLTLPTFLRTGAFDDIVDGLSRCDEDDMGTEEDSFVPEPDNAASIAMRSIP